MNKGAAGDRRKARPTRLVRRGPAAVPASRRRLPWSRVPVGVLLWVGVFFVLIGLAVFGALYLPAREARFASLEVSLQQPFVDVALLRLTYVAAPTPSGSVEHVAANGTTVTVPGGLASHPIAVRLYVDDDTLDSVARQLGATARLDTLGWRRVVTLSAETMSVDAADSETLRAATLPPSYRQTSMWGYRQELTFGFEQPPPDDPAVMVDVFPAPGPPWNDLINVSAVLTLDASYDPLGLQTEEPSRRRSVPLVLTNDSPSILQVDINPDESSNSWTLVLNGVQQADFVGPVSEITARGFDGLFRASAVRRPITSGDEVSMAAEGKPLFASYLDGRLSVTGVARSATTAFGDDLLPTRWDLWPAWAQTFAISAASGIVVGLAGYALGLSRRGQRVRKTLVRPRTVRNRSSRRKGLRRRGRLQDAQRGPRKKSE